MQSNLAYRDPRREERIGGRTIAVSPSPTINHNRVSGNLFHMFATYLRDRKCEYFHDGADVHLDEQNVFIPDGCVVCDPEKVRSDGIYGAPDLVIEILSPGTERRDRGVKKEAYAKHGVKEYWLIDPRKLTVEVFILEGENLEPRGVYSYDPLDGTDASGPRILRCELFPDLDIPLNEIFRRVLA